MSADDSEFSEVCTRLPVEKEFSEVQKSKGLCAQKIPTALDYSDELSDSYVCIRQHYHHVDQSNIIGIDYSYHRYNYV